MPKTKKKPSNKKRVGNKGEVTKKLILKDWGQEYFKITEMRGDGRFTIQTSDTNADITCVGIIRGSMRKRVWFKVGDFGIASLRDFSGEPREVRQGDLFDIFHKYNDDEVKRLLKDGRIPLSFTRDTNNIVTVEDDIIFEDEETEINVDEI